MEAAVRCLDFGCRVYKPFLMYWSLVCRQCRWLSRLRTDRPPWASGCLQSYLWRLNCSESLCKSNNPQWNSAGTQVHILQRQKTISILSRNGVSYKVWLCAFVLKDLCYCHWEDTGSRVGGLERSWRNTTRSRLSMCCSTTQLIKTPTWRRSLRKTVSPF